MTFAICPECKGTRLNEAARSSKIIDLGPGAGHDGGRIVFEGTPADLVRRGPR